MNGGSWLRLALCLAVGVLYQKFVVVHFLPLELPVQPATGPLRVPRGVCADPHVIDQLPFTGQGGSFIWREGVVLCREAARVDCLTKLGRVPIFWLRADESHEDVWHALQASGHGDHYYILAERPFGRPDGALYFEEQWRRARAHEWDVLALQNWDRPIARSDDGERCYSGGALLVPGAELPTPISIWRSRPPLLNGPRKISMLQPAVFAAPRRSALARWRRGAGDVQ